MDEAGPSEPRKSKAEEALASAPWVRRSSTPPRTPSRAARWRSTAPSPSRTSSPTRTSWTRVRARAGAAAAGRSLSRQVSRLTKEDRLPHLLLHGPPGTGKTSTILALARQLYGPSFRNMTLELNASDERGIDVVRSQISDFASTKRIFSTGFKLIVLDECDAMTKDAQFALRRVIEKYTRNTRFCLICNYVSKVIPALQSRCTRFRFAPLPKECVLERLRAVADSEQCAPSLPPKHASRAAAWM